MTQDYRINTFGLTQKQNQFVSANLPVRDCELYIADTDVYKRQTRSSTKWLDGNAYCKNEFKNK